MLSSKQGVEVVTFLFLLLFRWIVVVGVLFVVVLLGLKQKKAHKKTSGIHFIQA